VPGATVEALAATRPVASAAHGTDLTYVVLALLAAVAIFFAVRSVRRASL
jgi:hypothetical protein